MIKKTIFQGLIILLGFAAVWFGFSQLDFMRIFGVREHTRNLENRLGDMIWDEIRLTEDIVVEDTLTAMLDSLVNPICEANNIERDSLKIHIVIKDEVNAFALPNNHLVVYSGLIEDCTRQEALQGVLGHEIAHIERKHVMKKLSKELGYSVLISAAGGTRGGQMAKEILRTLSSSAYDRSLEKEADITSVDYLMKTKIDPTPMADFMYQMAVDSKLHKSMYWIADHPESEERAKYIMEYIKGKKLKSKPVLSDKSWKAFQEKLKLE